MMQPQFYFAIFTRRFGTASGTFLLPILTHLGGPALAMLVCTIVLLIGGIICLLWAPETSPKYTK